MPIFRIHNKRGTPVEESAMAGAYISKDVDQKVALYATYAGMSKAGLFNGILKQWRDTITVPEYQMIDGIAQEAEQEFERRMKKKQYIQLSEEDAFARFMQEVHHAARRRGLYNDHIMKIKWRLHERRQEKEKD